MFFNKKKKKSLPSKTNKGKKASKAKKATTKKKFFLFRRTKVDHKKQPILFKLFYLLFYFGLALFLLGCFSVWLYALSLDKKYHLSDESMAGALWELPSRVYARPLEFYLNAPLSMKDLKKELNDLDYIYDQTLDHPGTYILKDDEIIIYKREFGFWDRREPEQIIKVKIKNNKVIALTDNITKKNIPIVRLDPILIGSIYPAHQEDRVLVSLDEVPDVLIDGLIATEDRRFWSHPGIDLKGLLRALYQGIKSGHISQGASTLTQQFVKNHYLSSERRLSRKVKEAIMAIIIEKNYTKKQILEGYINEINLGQDGSRSIHGFGLASQFYFGKTLKELGLHQIASLIALVREPGAANPYSRPENAIKRRALILDVMVKRDLISQQDADLAKSLPLDILPKKQRHHQERYYSFLSLVYKQIHEHYDAKSLTAGLNVFTTLDPIVQEHAEKVVADSLNRLEKTRKLSKNFLQAASLTVDSHSGEVLAVVGDRDATRKGYNRAIQAKRQPGSLIKPVVYLTALEYPLRYSLATLLDDSPLEYRSGRDVWSPKNYEKTFKGNVILLNALVHSMNVPTARLGLDIGIDKITKNISLLGGADTPNYPSIVLGTQVMSPYEVTQMYETLANSGYYTPLRVIRYITNSEDEPIERFPIKSIKVIPDDAYYLIIKAMQDVARRGTGASMYRKLPASLNIAGKTGTTDDYRDSWFAGFSGNYLTVVWVGNDANKITRLTGSSGGLQIWTDIMAELPLTKLNPPIPNNIIWEKVDLQTGYLITPECEGTRKSETLPFISGSEPVENTNCLFERQYAEFYKNMFLNQKEVIKRTQPTNPNSPSNLWYNPSKNQDGPNRSSNPFNQRENRAPSRNNNFERDIRGGFNG